MRVLSRNDRNQIRTKLIQVIQSDAPECVEVSDTTSLIRSGMVDSERLVEISLLVEREVGREVDFSEVDLEKEWDTIGQILEFVEAQRRHA